MSYEYQFFNLKSWVRENANTRLMFDEDNKKYKGKLDRLEEEFNGLSENEESFLEWSKELSKREKVLLLYLYDEKKKDQKKSDLISFAERQSKEDRRIFKVAVDVLYQSRDVDKLWNLLRLSYAYHKSRHEKRMDSFQVSKWEKLLLSNEPVKHMASEAYHGENTFIEELSDFYLTENLPFFKDVLLEAFKLAGQDFYLKEETLYKKFFVEGTNLDQQQMAESLIQNCNLNQVATLGKLIFEKLKTYKRKPMLWNQVGDEEKRNFARWILQKELKDFFGDVNQNHERFIYWKKFIVNLEDVVITDEKKTLIMYFSDVVVMEVLGTGAVYIYTISTFNRHFQPKIDKMLSQREKHPNSLWLKEVKRADLMNKQLIVQDGWLVHSGGWQWKFDYFLRTKLNWEVNERVLSQKEAERNKN
jgi:hypothetical protein